MPQARYFVFYSIAFRARMKKHISLQTFLLFAAIIIYSISHLTSLESFPIYFLADEAVQEVKADYLLHHGFKDESGKLFPLFFQRFTDLYNLGTSVYFHVPAVFLFGKTIWAVRATTVLVTIIGLVYLAGILRNIYKVKNYWLAILFPGIIPMFFLHSRTGFETAMATSIFIISIYYYLRYREGKSLSFFISLLFAALAFYTYSGIAATVISTFLLFALTDFPYHRKHLALLLLGFGLAMLLALPLYQFRKAHPDIVKRQFEIYGIDSSVAFFSKENIGKIFSNYQIIFNPVFLFTYYPTYHPRHYIKNYGYLPDWALPVLLLGGLYLLYKIRDQNSRIILILLVTTPLNAAIIPDQGVTRLLALIIPITLLFGLAVKAFEEIIRKFLHPPIFSLLFSIGLFFFFFSSSYFFTLNTIRSAPYWFDDYGLYGMQYGARQLFEEIHMQKNYYREVIVSTSFANAVDLFFPFFLTEDQQRHVRLVGVGHYPEIPSIDDTLFIVDETEKIHLLSNKSLYRKIDLIKTLPDPNGHPLFYEFELEEN